MMDFTAAKCGEPDTKWLEMAIKENTTRTSIAIRTRIESLCLIISSKIPLYHEVAERF